MSEPIRVVITGAAGQIGYSLVYMLANGDVFGKTQPIILVLLDIKPMMTVLSGVTMELNDCVFPLLREIIATDDPQIAFRDAESIFLVGAMPRQKGMERKDLLSANVKIFKEQGQAIDRLAKKNCKILVVGNPANTNAIICSHFAPSIPRENISAMTRLDQNRGRSQIASRLGVTIENVKNVIIWGNHSSTQFPDVQHGSVCVNGVEKSIRDAVQDDTYLQNEFISVVQNRGAVVMNARKISSAMSAAKAACDHMRDWWFGTKPGEYVSMAVLSDGSYGVPKDIMFSFPVEIGTDGKWKIIQNLSIDSFARGKLDITANELLEEKEEAMKICLAD